MSAAAIAVRAATTRKVPHLFEKHPSFSTRQVPLSSLLLPPPTTTTKKMLATAANAAAENVDPTKMADTTAPPANKQATAAPATTTEQPLRVRRLTEAATLPVRGSALAAGYDVASAEDTEVPARGKALVSTGLVVAVPEGTYGRVAPRSGLAWKNFIDVGAGVIDADYRGELKVLLFNHSDAAFKGEGSEKAPNRDKKSRLRARSRQTLTPCAPETKPKQKTVSKGDRVAQLVLERIATPEVVEDADLGDTARGAGGFGSTGVQGKPQ
jgi:dUTP pyrophosphatase